MRPLKLKNLERWLNDLEPGLYAKWLANVRAQHPEDLTFSEVNGLEYYNCIRAFGSTPLRDLIANAFFWDDAPEGEDYWVGVRAAWEDCLPWWAKDLPGRAPAEGARFWKFRKYAGARTCIAEWCPFLGRAGELLVYAGCFSGSINEFAEKAYRSYGDNEVENYEEHVRWLRGLEARLRAENQ